MVRMIPPYPRDGANASERAVFEAFDGIVDRPDWVVIHSLSLAQNVSALSGEADFIVVAPGRGILLIEAKAPAAVEYRGGDWYLDRTPSPRKDPLKQLEAGRRSIRSFLRQRDLLSGDEPIARLLWFTSIARHHFENHSPGDMQFFEWELGWQDDLRKPTWLVEKVLDEHLAWFAEVDAVAVDPNAMTTEHAADMVAALLSDFKAQLTKADQRKDRAEREKRLLSEQRFALELVETNDHVYFDGPAGTGKSYLVSQAARRFTSQGKRTLVTCWNLLMADELRELMGTQQGNAEIMDLNAFMLSVCGLPTNPPGAGNDWYRHDLPQLALQRLREKPYLGGFEAICVDEFQDIAGSEVLMDVLLAAAGTSRPEGTHLVFAGDERQQILKPAGEVVVVFETLKRRIPDLVHVKVRRNCRTAPAVIRGAEELMGRSLEFSGHRMAQSVPGGVELLATAGTSGLATALRSLLEYHEADDIVVLSPFGEHSSLVGDLLARQEKSQDERWLRKQLAHDGGGGRVRWHSIFKYKGRESEAVILTDLDARGQDFAVASGVDWEDLRYVGLTRAKYRCIVVGGTGAEEEESHR